MTKASATGRPTLPPDDPRLNCDHGIAFDLETARKEGLKQEEVRRRFPRLDGTCPKGCGFYGVAYQGLDHFQYGGWS